jgi:hypothetical protein
MNPILRPSRVAVPLALVAVLATADARADDAPPVDPPDADTVAAANLHEALSIAAGNARDARTTVVVTGLVAGAALVPAGVVLAKRSDDVSRSIGVGMSVGGGVPLLFSLLSLRSSEMEHLASSFDTLRASGTSDAALVGQLESDWARMAEARHDRRNLGGAIMVGLGLALTGAGLYMLLRDPGVLGLSRNDQYTAGSFLTGPGVPILSVGIRALLQESIEETSWESYRATKSAHARPDVALPALSFAPQRGGGVATATLSF